MTTGTLPSSATDSLSTATAPGRAVTRLAVRQIRRGALLVIGLATAAGRWRPAQYRKDITLR
jgi:ABC-2 type transport system permease protein